jgi:hypothetical protein
VPLEDTLMVADDFLLPALALALAPGPAPDALLELLATVSCPEISENKNKEWACGEPISMTVHGRDYVGGLDEHLHCWKVGKE